MPQCGIFSEAGGKAICKHKKAANGTKRRKTDDITLSAKRKRAGFEHARLNKTSRWDILQRSGEL
jgi:hypothetical protein